MMKRANWVRLRPAIVVLAIVLVPLLLIAGFDIAARYLLEVY